MLQGRSIAAKPVPLAGVTTPPNHPVAVPGTLDRLLNTAEANAFLGRAKGFLEKRRSSGIDSPRYLQRTKRGAVLYRASDLIAWEEERVLTSSSDHDDPGRRRC